MSSPLHQLVTHHLGEPPARWVRRLRDQGMSWRAIANQLRTDTGVTVTHQTLRNWTEDAR